MLFVGNYSDCSCERIPIEYIKISNAIQSKQFTLLANVLLLNSHFVLTQQDYNLISSLPFPFNSLLANFTVKSHSAFTYHQSLESFTSFLKYISDSYDGRWQLQIMKPICQALYFTSKQESKIEDCARNLSKYFTLCITDRTNSLENSRKWAILHVVTLLFRIYFSLNNVRLCANILRAIENPKEEFPPLDHFPKSEFVSFAYFRCRLYLSDVNFEDALVLLKKAYSVLPFQCDGPFYKNKRKLLMYLIVAMIIVEDRYPKPELLQQFKLDNYFSALVNAIKMGNICEYLKKLKENQQFFIKAELYLILQIQMKQKIYRNLFRLIYHSYKKISQTEARLPFHAVVAGLAVIYKEQQDELGNWNNEHVECIAANLISKELMKGYIAHEKQIIVLSKVDPFPKK